MNKTELELIEEKYSVIGTEIPFIFKKYTRQLCIKGNVINWSKNYISDVYVDIDNHVSKGLFIKNEIKYIAFEGKNYCGKNYYLITPEELAKHIPKITETKNTEDPYKSFKLHEISTILNKHLDISDVNDIIQILDNHENN